MPAPRPLTQRARLVTAGVYLAAIGLVGCWALDWHAPPFGIRGLWFYSAAAALALGEFILEPFFTRPADAIANGAAVVLTAASVSASGAAVSDHALRVGRITFIAYGAAVVVLAMAAIWLKDAQGGWRVVGRTAYLGVGTFGRARWIFGALYFAAVYAAFSDQPSRLALLYIAWVVVFASHPLERVFEGRSYRGLLREGGGNVIATEDPRVVLAALPNGTNPRLGQTVTVGAQQGRIVDVTRIRPEPVVRITLDSPEAVRTSDEIGLLDVIDASVIGHLGPGTTIDEIVVQSPVTETTMALEEAQLVRAALGGREVLFQITGATLKEIGDTGGTRDVIEFRARKLGVWDASGRGFSPVPWVPSPGDVVQTFVVAGRATFDPSSIGTVPGTTYGVQLDVDAAVTHNTAILGILGSGKTHLAWEVMKRLLLQGVRVVALDITGRYEREFEGIAPASYREGFETRIEAAIAPSRSDNTVVDNEAGNVNVFRATLKAALRDWLDGDCPLLILNPLGFDVTKMEGRASYSGTAPTLSRLTMVEITRLVTEALLDLAIDTDHTAPNTDERARICLVLEEAHSLVPEWNAATGDAEKWAVNGTARAVLQGRKYGFGCLLVTQRTASVTKSILNQCNTIFALRAYDATGAGFLENYIGAAYAPMLASLKERQAIVFGRASSCAAPIAIVLNDAGAFNSAVWDPQSSALPRCEPSDIHSVPPEPEPESASVWDANDDIPF